MTDQPVRGRFMPLGAVRTADVILMGQMHNLVKYRLPHVFFFFNFHQASYLYISCNIYNHTRQLFVYEEALWGPGTCKLRNVNKRGEKRKEKNSLCSGLFSLFSFRFFSFFPVLYVSRFTGTCGDPGVKSRMCPYPQRVVKGD